MLTKKDYCDKDTAFVLQELGYNPYMFYDDGTPAIHLWYAQKWLREEKAIEVVVLSRGMIGVPYCFQVYTKDYLTAYDKDYASFEEALSEGIKETVKILKNK
jgi:hypothetical protein